MHVLSRTTADGPCLAHRLYAYLNINIADTNKNTIVGGTIGAIVGYIETQQSFIIALSYGESMGKNGYILLPYKYVENSDLVPELYYIDFDVTQIQNFIINKNKMLHSLPQVNRTQYGGLFS